MSGGDEPSRSTNGSHGGRHDGDGPAAAPGEADGAPSQSDQTRAALDQTASESDQTLADCDQTSADSDQSSADSDQLAADRDQAASDQDLQESNVDPAAHDRTRDIRRRTTLAREQTAQVRMEAADTRDDVADTRDVAGLARDQAAEARDLAMARRDSVLQQDDGRRPSTGADVVLRASSQRKRAAEHRGQAAEQRALAADDRLAAARDREQAALERRRSLVDREMLAGQIAIAETDHLTSARTRAAGLRDLDLELDRCRRHDVALVVAYIDIVGLKAVNERSGHGAGDALVQRVVASVRAHLRSYDLIVRVGGDEFLCAMSRMTLAEARERFGTIAGELAAAPPGGAITAGFAELVAGETAEELIARADGELMLRRHGRR